MSETKVLIADDDESIVWVLDRFLSEKRLKALIARDGVEAEKLIGTEGLKLAIIDINMPGRDGLEILKGLKGRGVNIPVIIMTAESTMGNAIEAMKLGAFDYIAKPFDLAEIEIILDRAMEDASIRKKLADMTERLKEKLVNEAAFIGKSKAVQSVFKTIGKAAPRDVTMLILGESGTGKELLARLIHMTSPRSSGPFVAVNSAAVPRELMESEIFGFEKGAFTGATEAKLGKFELADGGTLFLDEVGDMSTDLQARLLRVLQEKEFYRVGGKDSIRVDVRIIAATNQDLEKAVAEKRFREDLLFRLNGVVVTLPPLRERKGDIPLLIDYFLKKFNHEFGGPPKSLSKKAEDAMEGYPWPGNVRELENILRRAVILCPGSVISLEDLNLPQARQKRESLEDIISTRLKPFIDKTESKGNQELYDFIMPFMERPLIRLVLEKTRGNQVQAAELLGLNRNTLRKKIKELNIRLDKIKD
jgi:two-component system, NtrC family, nitrogen regulation response regulator GlnG